MRAARRLALAAGLLVALYAFVVEPQRLVVHHVPIALPAHPGLRGLRIAVLSDLHLGGVHMSAARLARVIARVNDEHPDLVFLLGDFVGALRRERDSLRPLTEALAGLRAPRGVYAVLGNHDWWFDGPGVTDALEAAGIVVLADRAVQVVHEGALLLVAGISDEATQRPHPGRWLSTLPPGLPILAITHNPDVFPRVPARVALTLAGHTHGGQVRLPWLGRAIVPSRYGQLYAAGHVVDGGRDLFVTTGVGTSILPLRLGVPPEIAVVTLE
jgi:uncharacterized protein